MTLDDLLGQLKKDGLERTIEDTVPCGGGRVICAGDELIDLCSNDYLGLAIDPILGSQLSQRALAVGVGARAARLLSGSRPSATRLERRFARQVGKESALLFNSGYHANVGIPSALTAPGSLIFSDAANHASIIDGCRLADAEVEVFAHNDLDALEKMLYAARDGGRLRHDCVNMLIIEGVFSMDGDRPDFQRLVNLKKRFDLLLMVDEAHGFGALGRRGLGACDEFVDYVDVYLATFGKAAGIFGAAVAASETVIRLLRSRARPFIFSTALPPALVSTLLTTLDLLEGPRGKELRLRLADNVLYFKAALKRSRVALPENSSHIIPLTIGNENAAVGAARALRNEGIYCRAIRFPTVPFGQARLRFSLSAIHKRPDLAHAASCISKTYRQLHREG